MEGNEAEEDADVVELLHPDNRHPHKTTERAILTKLNEIVHPAVFEDMIKWYAQNQNHKYVLQEAAIMYESGSYKMLDKTILVYADQEIRIERVMKRDKVDRIAVLARMDKQMPESEKLKLADFVIYNNGESLIDQVMKLHHTILELV